MNDLIDLNARSDIYDACQDVTVQVPRARLSQFVALQSRSDQAWEELGSQSCHLLG